ncbi:MAG: hypothetical protein HUU36_09730 [Candidatus Omnitrophica bacterium]|nr:hypothetical protein [Candidatus Omnitrophota bacterium]
MKDGWRHPAPEGWTDLVWTAIEEDVGFGDLSAGAIPPDRTARWMIEAQATGVVCGIGIANFQDLRQHDIIECYQMETFAATL